MRSPRLARMTVTPRLPHKPGKLWGVLAIIAAAIPLPFLAALNVLSVVVRANPSTEAGIYSAEDWLYGLLAFAGLFFFPLFFVLATVFGVLAVIRPRLSGRVMGWIAIVIVILAIPLLWFGYLVWIQNS